MAQDGILQMRVASDVLADLDDLRRKEKDIPSRSEMVRRLILRAAGREIPERSKGRRKGGKRKDEVR